MIISQNNKNNIEEIKRFINQVFEKYEDIPEKIYNIIDIMSSLISINDHYSYDRYTKMLGYSSLVYIPFQKMRKIRIIILTEIIIILVIRIRIIKLIIKERKKKKKIRKKR